jgi:hypothetical protein
LIIALRGGVSGDSPFSGRQRTALRALTTLLLLQAGYAYVPYSSLESVIEQSKEAYYLALRQTQGTIRTEAPNWQPWLVFFLRSLAEQVRRLEKKVEREKIVLASHAGIAATDRRVRPRARARHHRRCHQTDRGQPQHDSSSTSGHWSNAARSTSTAVAVEFGTGYADHVYSAVDLKKRPKTAHR